MFARAKKLDTELGHSIGVNCSNNKVRRALMTMPILSDLSRKFHMLTTDAKPDPPRVPVQENTNNFSQSTQDVDCEFKSKSLPTTPQSEHKCEPNNAAPVERQKSAPYGTTTGAKSNLNSTEQSDDDTDFYSKEQKKPSTKTKPKTKQGQKANIINYNIVNSNGVKIGSRTSYICNVNQYSANKAGSSESNWAKPKYRPMPENVESLTRCNDEITLSDILVVKTHLGHGWRDVARRLSYSEGQIEQFEENHRYKGIDEVIYQLLLDWKQANTKDAQIGHLVCILWDCQEFDCAEQLSLTHRNPS